MLLLLVERCVVWDLKTQEAFIFYSWRALINFSKGALFAWNAFIIDSHRPVISVICNFSMRRCILCAFYSASWITVCFLGWIVVGKKIQSCDREVCLTPAPSNDSRIKTITTSKVTSVTLSDEYFLRWLMSSMFHFVVCCIKSMLTWYVLVFNTSQMFLSLFLFSVISIHVGECSCKPLVNCRDFWYDHFPMGCPKSQSRSVSCEYDSVEQLTYTNVFNGSSFGHRPLERLCDFGRLMSAVTFTVPAPSLLCCLSVLRSTDTPL